MNVRLFEYVRHDGFGRCELGGIMFSALGLRVGIRLGGLTGLTGAALRQELIDLYLFSLCVCECCIPTAL